MRSWAKQLAMVYICRPRPLDIWYINKLVKTSRHVLMSVRANWIPGSLTWPHAMVMNSSLHWLLWKHLLVILHCTTLHYVRRHITRNLSSPPFGVGHLYRLGWCDDLAATETQWLQCTSASRSQWFCRWQIKTSHPCIQTDKTDWLYIRQPTGRLWTT